MSYYYVNQDAQAKGDHEVHVTGCAWMPTNKTYLGDYASCHPAVEQAKLYYTQTNGCYYCCYSCHTT